MFTDITGASNFTLKGTATDLTHLNSDFFGVSCYYTATRSAGCIFDDFNIAALTPDVKPPILSAKALQLKRNTTIASDGSFIWDGLNGNVIEGHMGTYLIKFDPLLQTEKWRVLNKLAFLQQS